MRSCLACAGVFALAISAAEPEWPRFRGPEANPAAESAKLPDRWSTKENVEWAASIPGRGWSSPIVSGKNIFLTSVVTDGPSKPPQIGTEYSNEYVAELQKQGLSMEEILKRVNARDIEMPEEVSLHYWLYCLDLDSGKIKWKREFHSGKPPGGRHRKNSFTSETPVTDGKRVYVYVTNLGLWAYDLSGKQIWKTPLEAYPIYLDFGTGASPVLLDNQLIVVNDNEKQQFLASFDKNTGKQIWRTERKLKAPGDRTSGSAWVTPYIWRHDGKPEIVTAGPGTAVSYDADGKELWRVAGLAPMPIPSPFAYEGLLYVNGGRGKPLFALQPGGKVAWSQARGGTYLSSSLAYRGAIYSLSEIGILNKFDAKSGNVVWRARIDGGIAFTSSPWAYDGKIFCLNEEGKTFVIDAAAPEYKLLGVNDLGEMAQATPAIVGDRLLLRVESKLYSLRKKR